MSCHPAVPTVRAHNQTHRWELDAASAVCGECVLEAVQCYCAGQGQPLQLCCGGDHVHSHLLQAAERPAGGDKSVAGSDAVTSVGLDDTRCTLKNTVVSPAGDPTGGMQSENVAGRDRMTTMSSCGLRRACTCGVQAVPFSQCGEEQVCPLQDKCKQSLGSGGLEVGV